MTQFWGPAAEAELQYRQAQLTKVAGIAGTRRRRRKVRRLSAKGASTAGVTRARPA